VFQEGTVEYGKSGIINAFRKVQSPNLGT